MSQDTNIQKNGETQMLHDTVGYLHRMSLPMQDKLRVLQYFPDLDGSCLDVGCADGAITSAMASIKGKWEFLGIDLAEDFIEKAKENTQENVDFEVI